MIIVVLASNDVPCATCEPEALHQQSCVIDVLSQRESHAQGLDARNGVVRHPHVLEQRVLLGIQQAHGSHGFAGDPKFQILKFGTVLTGEPFNYCQTKVQDESSDSSHLGHLLASRLKSKAPRSAASSPVGRAEGTQLPEMHVGKASHWLGKTHMLTGLPCDHTLNCKFVTVLPELAH